MAELNIKKEIGKRILEARKSRGLTLKALGELAGDLKQSRLTNWEQGTRAPGPEEIKQLAQALDVSPAFLMCLSDERQIKKTKTTSRLIPLLDHRQVSNLKFHIDELHGKELSGEVILISVSTELLPELSANAFALNMLDDSMIPEFKVNDILIIDPVISPKPGNYVTVKIGSKSEVIICQYKKLSYTSPEFELLTLNDHWPNVKVADDAQVEIIGVVVQKTRSY